jgi:hypothetical protein
LTIYRWLIFWGVLQCTHYAYGKLIFFSNDVWLSSWCWFVPLSDTRIYSFVYVSRFSCVYSSKML